MTARVARSRQEPLDPDETFSALITRLITTNHAEQAVRDRANKTGPTVHRAEPAIPDHPPERLRA